MCDDLPPPGPSPTSRSISSGRDDFDSKTKETLGRRVGFLCSNPQCQCATSGPHSNPANAVNIGVAAHISAASPGGPRYDAGLSPEARKHITNGIWLCQSCAKLVDNDVASFPSEKLRKWKDSAEQYANSLIEQKLSAGWANVLPEELKPLISLELTTPPPITRNIAQSSDGQFWLVYWDCMKCQYRWEKISQDYATEALQPVARYRNMNDWRDLFNE